MTGLVTGVRRTSTFASWVSRAGWVVLVGGVLVAVVPGLRRVGRAPRIRPLAIARLTRYMLANAVRSNVTLIREILSPGSQLRTGIIEVRMPDCSDELLTVITSLLALTPGTMPVDLDTKPDDAGPHPPTVRVHVLHLESVDQTRREIEYLAGLAIFSILRIAFTGTPA